MSLNYSYALLTIAVVTLSCGRPAPSHQASRSDSPPTAVPAPSPSGVNSATPPSRVGTPEPPAASTTPSPRPGTPPPPATPSASTTIGSEDTPPPLRDAYHSAPLDTVDARTYQGWKYFNLNCSRCHGEDVSGTTIAPHLILSLKPDGPIPNEEVFLQTVCGGRLEKGMPAWCSLGMTPAQIDTIYAYVKGRSDARIHPGRPARRAQ